MSAISVVAKLAMFAATSALILMVLLVVLSTVMRYVVGAPFGFSEEFVGLLFVAMAFLVWPLSTLRGEHISVTFISEQLPAAARRWATGLSFCGAVVFCVVFGKDSYDFAMFTLKVGGRSDVGGIPLFPWMAVMPVVCALIVLALVAHLIGRRWRGEPPPMDEV